MVFWCLVDVLQVVRVRARVLVRLLRRPGLLSRLDQLLEVGLLDGVARASWLHLRKVVLVQLPLLGQLQCARGELGSLLSLLLLLLGSGELLHVLDGDLAVLSSGGHLIQVESVVLGVGHRSWAGVDLLHLGSREVLHVLHGDFAVLAGPLAGREVEHGSVRSVLRRLRGEAGLWLLFLNLGDHVLRQESLLLQELQSALTAVLVLGEVVDDLRELERGAHELAERVLE